MLSALAFNIIPTMFEVGLVTGVLVCACYLVAAYVHIAVVTSFSFVPRLFCVYVCVSSVRCII